MRRWATRLTVMFAFAISLFVLGLATHNGLQHPHPEPLPAPVKKLSHKTPSGHHPTLP